MTAPCPCGLPRAFDACCGRYVSGKADAPDAEPQPKWLGLQVKSHRQIDATHAEVEFIARYKIGGRAHRMHETSRFVREEGQWYYLDGDIKES